MLVSIKRCLPFYNCCYDDVAVDCWFIRCQIGCYCCLVIVLFVEVCCGVFLRWVFLNFYFHFVEIHLSVILPIFYSLIFVKLWTQLTPNLFPRAQKTSPLPFHGHSSFMFPLDVRESNLSACFIDASIGAHSKKTLEVHFFFSRYAWSTPCPLLLLDNSWNFREICFTDLCLLPWKCHPFRNHWITSL